MHNADGDEDQVFIQVRNVASAVPDGQISSTRVRKPTDRLLIQSHGARREEVVVAGDKMPLGTFAEFRAIPSASYFPIRIG